MKICRLPLFALLMLPLTALGQQWTEAQQEVLDWEEGCLAENEPDLFANCFHEDFVGWGMDYPAPTSKMERMQLDRDNFERADNELLLFKPLSVSIRGDVAIIIYLNTAKTTDRDTGEVEITTSRWTDIAVRNGQSWQWIADQGEDITED